VKTVKVEREDSPKDLAEKIKAFGGDEGIQCALECTGVESSVSSAIYVKSLLKFELTSSL